MIIIKRYLRFTRVLHQNQLSAYLKANLSNEENQFIVKPESGIKSNHLRIKKLRIQLRNLNVQILRPIY